jgi:hypothetical protein
LHAPALGCFRDEFISQMLEMNARIRYVFFFSCDNSMSLPASAISCGWCCICCLLWYCKKPWSSASAQITIEQLGLLTLSWLGVSCWRTDKLIWLSRFGGDPEKFVLWLLECALVME